MCVYTCTYIAIIASRIDNGRTYYNISYDKNSNVNIFLLIFQVCYWVICHVTSNGVTYGVKENEFIIEEIIHMHMKIMTRPSHTIYMYSSWSWLTYRRCIMHRLPVVTDTFSRMDIHPSILPLLLLENTAVVNYFDE